MPRYLVQRSFPGGLALPANETGAEANRSIVKNNAQVGVTWIHSYVTPDKETTFCVYDGPDQDAVRQAAELNHLPVVHITEVSVLNPYFYH
jgi:hypothetical protein